MAGLVELVCSDRGRHPVRLLGRGRITDEGQARVDLVTNSQERGTPARRWQGTYPRLDSEPAAPDEGSTLSAFEERRLARDADRGRVRPPDEPPRKPAPLVLRCSACGRDVRLSASDAHDVIAAGVPRVDLSFR